MWQRGFILTLALNLVIMVPLPLSVCAMPAGLDGPCQCPMTMPCGPEAQPTARNGGQAISCLCIQSAAPSPEAVQDAASTTPAVHASGFVSVSAPHQLVFRANFSITITAADLPPVGMMTQVSCPPSRLRTMFSCKGRKES